jgi:hypothetical protein
MASKSRKASGRWFPGFRRPNLAAPAFNIPAFAPDLDAASRAGARRRCRSGSVEDDAIYMGARTFLVLKLDKAVWGLTRILPPTIASIAE